MTMLARPRFRWLPVLAALLLTSLAAAQPARADEARFTVTGQVVNSDAGPFTATVWGSGYTLERKPTGFEPAYLRNIFVARGVEGDRIFAHPQRLGLWWTLRDGAFDGADVEVFRIENGRFRHVRSDRVREGGFAASGWGRAVVQGHARVIAAPQTRAALKLGAGFPDRTPIWLAVAAVDTSGRFSALSDPVRVVTGKTAKTKPAKPETIALPRGATRQPGQSDLPAPANLRAERGADGIFALSWDSVPGDDLLGYHIMRSEVDPASFRGFHVDLAGGSDAEELRAGDLVVLGRKILDTPASEIVVPTATMTGRLGRKLDPGPLRSVPNHDPAISWRRVRHDPDTPVEAPGESYLELTLGAGKSADLHVARYAGTEGSWYDVLQPKSYRLEAWVRADRPAIVAFDLGKAYKAPKRALQARVGTSWQKISIEIRPIPVPQKRTPYNIRLKLRGEARFDIDNLRIYPADKPYLAATEDWREKVVTSGISALRTHSFVKSKHVAYDMAQLTNEAGLREGDAPFTLPQMLGEMSAAGVDPWLQIEPYFGPRDLHALVEFLAAEFDPSRDTAETLPWAAKRAAQGRQRPWTEAFERIYFELGNEMWNPFFRPWIAMPLSDAATGERYSAAEMLGLYNDWAIRTMRESPHWAAAGLEDKLVSVIGGQLPTEFGMDAAAASKEVDILTHPAYNGGWDADEGPATTSVESLANILNQVSQSTIHYGDRFADAARRIAHRRGRKLGLGTYEAGPGYALNGLNGWRVTPEAKAEQEKAMKSQAAGVATLDSFLALAERGYSLQNFFTFGTGDYWTSHAKWHRGGHAFPSWALLALYNTEAAGEMLRVETQHVPTRPLRAFRHRVAVDDAPQVAAYATRRGDRLAVFVLSRRVDGYPDPASDGFTRVTLDLPIRSARRLTLHSMAGPYAAHNVFSEDVTIRTADLPVPAPLATFEIGPRTGMSEKGLPPGSALVYVFDGVEFAED